ETDANLRRTAQRLGIVESLPLSLIKLSNGQMRRARLAKALLRQPELLILDDPFMGLDSNGRADVEEILRELTVTGVRLLLISKVNEIPDWVTHVAELES